MNQYLYSLDKKSISEFQSQDKMEALAALESGKVVFLPNYCFTLNQHEHMFTESILSPNRKNVSYDFQSRKLSGVCKHHSIEQANKVRQFMHRYAEFSRQLLESLLPSYQNELRLGRTSYRPAEIQGRKSSKLKDDTRLHVDSFPATPVNGQRILRVFCNINPEGKPRVWHLGEPFSQVLEQFSSKIPRYNALQARLLKLCKVTKTFRTPYDHAMLNLHNLMKLDDAYQTAVKKLRFDFPAQSTWLVYTDQVSHAALSGQFLLEQTFYLPVSAMKYAEFSPLRQLEKVKSLSLA
ncbi:Kdo hydroxylase family protein [Legionella londiniensis]|nr:Kdo hydroxylase family protein [Legionella londiniensis]